MRSLSESIPVALEPRTSDGRAHAVHAIIALACGLALYTVVRPAASGTSLGAHPLSGWLVGSGPTICHTAFVGYALSWADQRRTRAAAAAIALLLGFALELTQGQLWFDGTRDPGDLVGVVAGALLVTFTASRIEAS